MGIVLFWFWFCVQAYGQYARKLKAQLKTIVQPIDPRWLLVTVPIGAHRKTYTVTAVRTPLRTARRTAHNRDPGLPTGYLAP